MSGHIVWWLHRSNLKVMGVPRYLWWGLWDYVGKCKIWKSSFKMDWYGYNYRKETYISQLLLLWVKLPKAFLQDKDPLSNSFLQFLIYLGENRNTSAFTWWHNPMNCLTTFIISKNNHEPSLINTRNFSTKINYTNALTSLITLNPHSLIFTTSIWPIKHRWKNNPKYKTPIQLYGQYFEPIDWSADIITETLHWVHFSSQPHFSSLSNLAIDDFIPTIKKKKNKANNIDEQKKHRNKIWI